MVVLVPTFGVPDLVTSRAISVSPSPSLDKLINDFIYLTRIATKRQVKEGGVDGDEAKKVGANK